METISNYGRIFYASRFCFLEIPVLAIKGCRKLSFHSVGLVQPKHAHYRDVPGCKRRKKERKRERTLEVSIFAKIGEMTLVLDRKF